MFIVLLVGDLSNAVLTYILYAGRPSRRPKVGVKRGGGAFLCEELTRGLAGRLDALNEQAISETSKFGGLTTEVPCSSLQHFWGGK